MACSPARGNTSRKRRGRCGNSGLPRLGPGYRSKRGRTPRPRCGSYHDSNLDPRYGNKRGRNPDPRCVNNRERGSNARCGSSPAQSRRCGSKREAGLNARYGSKLDLSRDLRCGNNPGKSRGPRPKNGTRISRRSAGRNNYHSTIELRSRKFPSIFVTQRRWVTKNTLEIKPFLTPCFSSSRSLTEQVRFPSRTLGTRITPPSPLP